MLSKFNQVGVFVQRRFYYKISAKVPRRKPRPQVKRTKAVPDFGGPVSLRPTAKAESFYSAEAIYPEVVPPKYYKGFEALANRKKEIGERTALLPTIEQRLKLLNPFERNWTVSERRWHRPWHAPLAQPRGAFRLEAVPHMYNAVPLYQFCTKTHVVAENALPSFYDGVPLNENLFDTFKNNFTQNLASDEIVEKLRSINDSDELYDAMCGDMLQHLYSAALFASIAERPDLMNDSVCCNVPIESWWIRGGYQDLYDNPLSKKLADEDANPPIQERYWPKENPPFKMDGMWDNQYTVDKIHKIPRLPSDHVEKLGEFLFILRDRLPLLVRTELPLAEFADIKSELSTQRIPAYAYNPIILGAELDYNPFFMKPGLEASGANAYSDKNVFCSLIGRSCRQLTCGEKSYMKRWDAEPGEAKNALVASAIALGFTTLNGSAHYLGFSQYNSMTYPLTTQIILTDGPTWHFFVYQLNTIDISSWWTEDTTPCNLLWYSGAQELFKDKNMQSYNDDVLRMALKFVLNKPQARSVELRPHFRRKQPTQLPVKEKDAVSV